MKNITENKSKFAVVAAYEFRKMAFNKTFVITTLLGPFLLAAITILPSLIAMKSIDRSGEALHVGIHAADEASRANAELLLVPAFTEMGWVPVVSGDASSLRASVLDKTLDGYLELPASFPKDDGTGTPGWYSKSTTDVGVFSAVEDVVSGIIVSARIAASGSDEVYVRSLVKPVSLSVYKVSSSAEEDGSETGEGDFVGALLTALAFCMLIYMTVLLYGQQIGRSVVAEKSSKIVDILLSSVRSEDLLYGKIFGIGVAGLLQYAVWISFAAILLGVVGPAVNFEIPVHVGMDKFVWLVLFFIGGYLLYSSLYAACGAASEDDQHMAQLAMPILIFLMVPMILLQAFIQRPDSIMSVVLSYFPFTSPMVMLIRTLVSPVEIWKVALSLVLLAVTVLATGKLAAKIFRTGILMTGKNFTFKDIARWLRA